MKIISHRGYWITPDQKNTEIAFGRSFEKCFGIETDIRDCDGHLVVSHNVPAGAVMSVASLFKLTNSYPCSCQERLTFALNIKSDGLAEMVGEVLEEYPELDCFVFDMSVPDMRSFLLSGIPVFTRLSEFEQSPVWLSQSAGVWLDCFESEWYSIKLIEELLLEGKRVCIVSPELHGRPYRDQWKKLRDIDDCQLMLCTDYPADAEAYFAKD